nr:putative reverse transcriptase domain-containing protein [Tanacetum cinerariifolium]
MSFTGTNLRGLAYAITTRSGLNYNPPKNPLEEINDTQIRTTENISTKREGTPENKKFTTKTYAPPIPFPRRLKKGKEKEKEKEKEQFKKFFKNLKQLSRNIPLIEAFEQMPKYAKFIKDLLTQRGRANMFKGEKHTTKLKDLPSHLEYAFLNNNQEFPVIISSLLFSQEKELLLGVLTKHKSALAWKVADIKGISPSFCTYKILMEENFKPVVQPQCRLNPKVQDVVKAKIVKLLSAGLSYAISDSPWVSRIHVVPKKGGITVVTNNDNELVSTRTITGWRVCIDYRKLNDATRKDYFPLPFIDQILERLYRNEYYCFLDGFSGYFQIPLAPEDQEKPHSLVLIGHLLIGEFVPHSNDV